MKGNSKISFLQQNSFFCVLFNLFFIQIQCFWISTPFDLISYKKSLLQPKMKLIYTFIPTSYWSAAHLIQNNQSKNFRNSNLAFFRSTFGLLFKIIESVAFWYEKFNLINNKKKQFICIFCWYDRWCKDICTYIHNFMNKEPP